MDQETLAPKRCHFEPSTSRHSLSWRARTAFQVGVDDAQAGFDSDGLLQIVTLRHI